MRALFRPFVLHAAYTPIETIVFFCIVGTLCYFHILSAIKNSSFLDPAPAAPIVVKPAWAVYRAGEWVGVRESVWAAAVKAAESEDTVLELQQVIVNLDAGKSKYLDLSDYQRLSLTDGPLSLSVHNLSGHLTTSFRSPAGRDYSAVCHVAGDKCFDAQQIGTKTFVQTLAFKPGMREEWMSALVYEPSHAHYLPHHPAEAPRSFVDENGVRFEIDLAKMVGETTPLGQMKNGRWVAYAARSLVLRFWDLAKKADSLDILLILAGYILMHTTFYLLLVRSRSLGSSFWLPLAILSSSVLALLISLPIAMALRIPIDPVALTEALPFLVCTVGFDKPLRLARAVFLHPHLTVPPSMAPGDSASGYPITTSNNTSSLAPPASAPSGNSQALKPAPKIITESLTLVYVPIIRDYVLEIAVLTVGAYSKVGGLKEVCALAALILSVDCLLMCTYLAAIFGVMVEVRRIKTVRAMTRSRSNSITSSTSSVLTARRQSAMSRPQVPPPPPTLRQRLSRVLLGEKGDSLPGYLGYNNTGARVGKAHKMKLEKGKEIQKRENPVARLKLLLIASFLTLHILNLITPLTPSRHSNSTSLNTQVNIRKVDITASGLRAVFNALVDASPVDIPRSANDSIDSSDISPEIFVKVLPPVYVRAVPSTAIMSATSAPFTLPDSSATLRAFIPKSGSERVESFMSAWTRLVGDPILSKWITILLAISITLNGYLLKGIAAGVVGVRLSHFGVRGGVRFEDDHQETEETHEAPAVQIAPKEVEAAPVPAPPAPTVQRVEHQSAPREVVPAVPTFTLEDVDKKLQIAKANSRRQTVTVNSYRASLAGGANRVSDLTPPSSSSDTSDEGIVPVEGVRELEEIIDIFENGPRPLSTSLALLNDEEVILLCQNGKIAAYALEKVLGMNELERAVKIRRALISRASKTQTLESSDIPLVNYDYSRVLGACCENVVGYIPLPLGIAGPLNIDGNLYPIPMATAEGTLVASTSRGCKALNAGGGVTTVLTQDAMTRGPAIDFPTITMAAHAKAWIDSGDGYTVLKAAFESTSRFARLKSLKTAMAGRTLFVRFATATGDAMGMNMISKGTEKALEAMQNEYPEMVVLALSGNYCTDKKPAAINWIEGRGKSVVAEAVIPGKIVKSVLKTTVASLVNLNTKKNLVGSAMAGSIGGFNAHAANILTAIFLATGQDPAQNVESSMCMTLMEATNDGEDLLMTVSMPCIEVGTVGGGTVLAPQQGVLDMLGMRGAHPTHPGTNAQALARLIAAAVMAGELSLLSALAAGHLIRAHMAHNRSVTNTPAASAPPTPGAEIVGGKGHGQLAPAPEGEPSTSPLPLLTPSPSTNSLPPYSQ